MTTYPIETVFVIDGVEAYVTADDLAAGRPTVLDGVSFGWGRGSLADQPEPGNISFNVREQVADGDAGTIKDAVRVGRTVEIWARSDDGTTGGDTQQWQISDRPPSTDLPSSLWAPTRPGDNGLSVTMSTTSVARCRPSPTSDNWAAGVVFAPDQFSSATGAWDHIQRLLPGQVWQVTVTARMPAGGGDGMLYVLVTSSTARDGVAGVAPVEADPFPNDGEFHTITGTVTLPESWDDPEGAWVLPGAFAINNPAGSYLDIKAASTTPTSATNREVLVWAGDIAKARLTPAGDNAVLAAVTAVDPASALANTTIGDDPWPVQSVEERATRIIDLAEDASFKRYELLVDEPLRDVRVQARDVDAQPAQDLASTLAATAGAALWPAASAARGAYLWMEDPQSRRSSRVLTVDGNGIAQIVPAPTGAVAELTAGDILRDPISWDQDPSTIASSVDVKWLQAYGRDPETGSLNTVERTVTVTDYDLVDEFGLRKLSVDTELAYRADAVDLATRMLKQAAGTPWMFDGLVIDTRVLTRAPLPDGPSQADRLTLVLDLLDGARRIGKAVNVPDMPAWTPGGTEVGLFIEGGTYTLNDGKWLLELRASPAAGQGHSVTWNEMPVGLTWDEMGDITWDDLHGVGI